MGGAIRDAGGQILDFIGDGVLAVFPVVRGGLTERRACERALAAARDADGRLSKTNADRARRGLPRLTYGLGLHLGEVMFGNIGTPDRLAYSVIGTSVNQVSRLQDMTKTLKRTPVVSGAFADKLGTETWDDLGTHKLRGVTEPMRLLAPAR
jgi:adenylate cyclase